MPSLRLSIILCGTQGFLINSHMLGLIVYKHLLYGPEILRDTPIGLRLRVYIQAFCS